MLTREQEERLAEEARKVFGTRLGIARAAIYPDQDSAGAALGLRPRRWGAYEGGRREPPLWILRKLPELFHRPLSWFFDLPDERGLSDAEGQIVSLLRAIKDPDTRAAADAAVVRILEAQVALDQGRRSQATG